ncbi:MAG: F-type H+-transporting ATPase subunit b [Solirubrobacteraceae bacterium]|jgi:F-type H+-transporting ATPase subunit b|nr:F-type H+-transporting ATPase subunit b [Solirubrobacteraceae bacterium]
MSAIRIGLLAAEASDKENLYPHASELVVGAVAFAVIFFFMWKWVIPRINTMLEERRTKIQGELERAEETRREADHILEEYRAQLTGAREEAGRIIEETRKTAEQLRKDMLGKAEEESQGIVARAQDEIRAERDRVFQELRSQIGEISVELAARIVGESLDEAAHQRLIDEYIDQVAGSGSGQA